MRQLFITIAAVVCTATIAFAQPADRVLELDFPSLHIGVAENSDGPTGMTVFYFPKGAMLAVDARGGAPATINTDVLKLSYETSFVDAITVTAGSSYGLEAATGVAAELRAQRGNSGDWNDIATVVGAVVFDLGPRRFNTAYPDKDMGRAALRAAQPGRFPLGARGAGRFVTQGGFFGGWEYRQHSGQGGAVRELGSTKVAVFTVVNALGAIVDRQGRVVRCYQPSPNTPCPTATEYINDAIRRRGAPRVASEQGLSANTTITVVVTNAKLGYWALNRLAVTVHSSLARAIQPFHMLNDGDMLFAATTNEVDSESLSIDVLGALAAEAAWDAVLSSVPALPVRATQIVPMPAGSERYIGTYEFAPNARLTIARGEQGRLTVEATGTRDVWAFFLKNRYELQPVSNTEFISTNLRRDRLMFTADGVVLNPGPWEMRARRVP
jgi:L-aminopeptidase/D-esterase-like protein